MGKLGFFLLGVLLSSWVSCAVCYFAGRAMLADLGDLQTKAIDAIRGAHADLIGVFSKIEAKASAVREAITK